MICMLSLFPTSFALQICFRSCLLLRNKDSGLFIVVHIRYVSLRYIGITRSALSLFTSYLPNFKSLKVSLKALF